MAKETSLGSTPKENVGILLIAYFLHVRITEESSYENEAPKDDYENTLTIAPVVSYWIQGARQRQTILSQRERKEWKGKDTFLLSVFPSSSRVRIGILWPLQIGTLRRWQPQTFLHILCKKDSRHRKLTIESQPSIWKTSKLGCRDVFAWIKWKLPGMGSHSLEGPRNHLWLRVWVLLLVTIVNARICSIVLTWSQGFLTLNQLHKWPVTLLWKRSEESEVEGWTIHCGASF